MAFVAIALQLVARFFGFRAPKFHTVLLGALRFLCARLGFAKLVEIYRFRQP